jgi:hypothetical protein
MRARIAWIVAGIVGAAAIVGWIVAREHGTSNPEGAPEADQKQATGNRQQATGNAGDRKSTPGPERSIPVVRIRPAEPGLAPAEQRDDAWAAEREAELEAPLGAIATEVGVGIAVACGTRTCRIRVEASDPGALGATLSRLEEPGGLHGIADTMVVGKTTTLDDGRIAVDVDAVWDRE